MATELTKQHGHQQGDTQSGMLTDDDTMSEFSFDDEDGEDLDFGAFDFHTYKSKGREDEPTLLGIPGELRNLIYEYIWTKPEDGDIEVMRALMEVPHPGLSRTCQLLRRETLNLYQDAVKQFYEDRVFEIVLHEHALKGDNPVDYVNSFKRRVGQLHRISGTAFKALTTFDIRLIMSNGDRSVRARCLAADKAANIAVFDESGAELSGRALDPHGYKVVQRLRYLLEGGQSDHWAGDPSKQYVSIQRPTTLEGRVCSFLDKIGREKFEHGWPTENW